MNTKKQDFNFTMNMLYDSESFVVVHILTPMDLSEAIENPQNSKSAKNSTQTIQSNVQFKTNPLNENTENNINNKINKKSKSTAQPNNANHEHNMQWIRHGFEIVDKRSGKELYLDGSWAELFQQQIMAWEQKTPTQEEVEELLSCYAELAQNPVVVH